jgi:hypothetical protein
LLAAVLRYREPDETARGASIAELQAALAGQSS